MLWELLNAGIYVMHMFPLKLASVINTRIKRDILKTRNPLKMPGIVSSTRIKIFPFYPEKVSGITQKPLKSMCLQKSNIEWQTSKSQNP